MPIESDLLPAEEFHRAVMEAARVFYDQTGVRAVQVKLSWQATMGSAADVVDVDVAMES
ncbi:response regulator receiver modulated diguanylate cyclase/phosphodiesterase with PAS/PAC sensor(s) [Solidesulfovibrio carbinoliphilus subsp. oakridgensis]|uniref:Response regulator receiver modulated diguanylate cyclase/phosphodiesterase with PAS/PAC sensor(S) n=1 Tax=Solidesulfovibrio carbinoliphilus subsp. oakridgensis TaxID=694327 RepID=G7QC51_9BACT|nr:hypothetical protein [Solidesulfovibrio carbinoliphilus]EHJ49497.1 response regulator receiver modulated diguanylate cyclase/phosphodiesterase with PAS/PAC sensor(s) [Solidesulfovibrio carbinoliphilus subsp. oakridgensis]